MSKCTGLNTVNLSTINTWQQIILFLLMIIGSQIFVSSSILRIRKRAFESKFAELIEKRRRSLHRPRGLTFSWSRKAPSVSDDHEAAVASGAVRGRPILDPPEKAETNPTEEAPPWLTEGREALHTENETAENNASHIRFLEQLPPVEHPTTCSQIVRRNPTRFFEGRGVGAHGLGSHPRNTQPLEYPLPALESADEEDPSPSRQIVSKLSKYVDTLNGYVGRNSQFHHLSEKERKQLGGIEYDALCLLSWLVPTYFILWQLLGVLGVGAWFYVNLADTTRANGK